MALQQIKNIQVRGIAACVPEHTENNRLSVILGDEEQIDKYIVSTGVEKRHTINGRNLCASDMAFAAGDLLLTQLGWNREEVDCLIFVSQTPDYILPATSCILQDRLGLSTNCFALDISLGCSGWIHGMATMSALLQNGGFKKGLLLTGDTSTVTKSPKDKSTFPLFGDAGTATALEFSEGAEGIKVHTSTDGKGHKSIIIPDGGFRNFYNENSKVEEEFEDGIIRSRLDTILDGPAVFTFGITKAPRSVKALVEHFQIDMDSIDYVIFHQANKLLVDKIRSKLKIPVEKVPYCLEEFGNTSSSSIPLTMVTRLSKQLSSSGESEILACGFGVGLSWGSLFFKTNNLVIPPIIII